jgi:hypothetical protein
MDPPLHGEIVSVALSCKWKQPRSGGFNVTLPRHERPFVGILSALATGLWHFGTLLRLLGGTSFGAGSTTPFRQKVPAVETLFLKADPGKLASWYIHYTDTRSTSGGPEQDLESKRSTPESRKSYAKALRVVWFPCDWNGGELTTMRLFVFAAQSVGGDQKHLTMLHFDALGRTVICMSQETHGRGRQFIVFW